MNRSDGIGDSFTRLPKMSNHVLMRQFNWQQFNKVSGDIFVILVFYRPMSTSLILIFIGKLIQFFSKIGKKRSPRVSDH